MSPQGITFRGVTARLTPFEVIDKFMPHYKDRPWAATANRRLKFAKINRVLRDCPPAAVMRDGYRIFLFRSGNDRDRFVECFHHKYEAKAYAPS